MGGCVFSGERAKQLLPGTPTARKGLSTGTVRTMFTEKGRLVQEPKVLPNMPCLVESSREGGEFGIRNLYVHFPCKAFRGLTQNWPIRGLNRIRSMWSWLSVCHANTCA